MKPIFAIGAMIMTINLAAQSYAFDAGSVFAVITQKDGLASALAHNHFIEADQYECTLEVDGDQLEEVRFEFKLKVEDLVVDDPESHEKWYPRLNALQILDEPFSEVSPKDRKKIREAMLGKKQLQASAYPEIHASIQGVELSEQGDTTHRVQLAFQVVGKTIIKQVPVRIETGIDGELYIEAFAEFRFTEFGIKPYSAVFGAVRNQDRFHLYVNLIALKQ